VSQRNPTLTCLTLAFHTYSTVSDSGNFDDATDSDNFDDATGSDNFDDATSIPKVVIFD